MSVVGAERHARSSLRDSKPQGIHRPLRTLCVSLIAAISLTGCGKTADNSGTKAAKDQATVRLRAVQKLAEEGAAGVPELLSALQDPDFRVREQASASLRQVGAAGVPSLVVACGDEEAIVRRSAVTVLGSLGSEAREALPTLKVAAMRDPHVGVRLAAIAALREVAEDDATVVEALGKLLGDPHENVRLAAISALQKIGPGATAALPMVLDGLQRGGGGPTFRWRLTYVLASMGPDAVPQLIEALRVREKPVRIAAAAALQQIGPPAAGAIPALREALEDPDVQLTAASALAAIGAPPDDLMPKLVAMAEKLERQYHETMVALRAEAGPVPDIDAVSALRSDESANVRRLVEQARGKSYQWQGIIDSIGRLGAGTGETIPVLERAIQEDDHQVALAAATATWRITGRADVADVIIASAAKTRFASTTGPAMDVLQAMGHDAVPSLVAALNSPDARVRKLGAAGLGRLGPEAADATRALGLLLKDDDSGVRLRAAEALWRVTQEPERPVEVLAALLRLGDRTIAPAAAQVLGEIGPRAESALPALRKAARASDIQVASAIQEAVKKIESAKTAAQVH